MPSPNRLIDLTLLHTNKEEKIDISGEYYLSDEYKNEEVLKVNKILVEGNITRKENSDNEEDDYIECLIKTSIIMEDSISLEEIEVPISTNFSDFLEKIWKKDENKLDIFEFLWENIVLEVPLRFTKVKDLSKFHGDGWRLISEEERNQASNPFNELINEMEREG